MWANKNATVRLHTRVTPETAEILARQVSDKRPLYRVVHDILESHAVKSNPYPFNSRVLEQLQAVVKETGYKSVDALVQDLAAAFLNTYRQSRGKTADNEPYPAEEIREMFDDMMTSTNRYEKDLRVKKRKV